MKKLIEILVAICCTTTLAAPVVYWTDDIAGNSAAVRVTVQGQPAASGWSGALATPTYTTTALTLPSGFVAGVNTVGSTAMGTRLRVSLRNMSGAAMGALETVDAPTTNVTGTMQAGSPLPTSLYPSSVTWTENGGDNATKNAVLFQFDDGAGNAKGIAGFGAWFGDLETVASNNAIVRLFDVNGNQIGSDKAITNSYSEAACGNAANLCGNNSTRWIGFSDTSSSVASMLVIVGDNTSGQNGFNQHIGFVGTTLAEANPTVTLTKNWVNAKIDNKVSLAITGGTGATAGNSTAPSTTVNATSFATAGNTITLSETFSVGSAADYDAVLTCVKSSNSSAITVTSNSFTMPNASNAVCTYTNTLKKAKLQIRKIWNQAHLSDKVTLTTSGLGSGRDITLASTATAVSVTDTSPVVDVASGEAITLNNETWNVGNVANYSVSAWVCDGGTLSAASPPVLTINVADLGKTITCAVSNTRSGSKFLVYKQWKNAVIGNEVKVNASVPSGNLSNVSNAATANQNTYIGGIEVFPGDTVDLNENWGIGAPSNYSSSWACNNASGVLTQTSPNNDPLRATLTIVPADVGKVLQCTVTNEPQGAQLFLVKEWSGAQIGDAINLNATYVGGALFTAFDSPATSTNFVDTRHPGASAKWDTKIQLSETWVAGDSATYATSWSCQGDADNTSFDFDSSNQVLNIPSGTKNKKITCTTLNLRAPAKIALTKKWDACKIGDDVYFEAYSNTGTINKIESKCATGSNEDTSDYLEVYVGTTITISDEKWIAGNNTDYNVTGPVCLNDAGTDLGNKFVVSASDGAINCTYTNARKAAQLYLYKDWTNAILNDEVKLLADDGPGTLVTYSSKASSTTFLDNAHSGASLSAERKYQLSESWTNGSVDNYNVFWSCEGKVEFDSGANVIYVPPEAVGTKIICTASNMRKSAEFMLSKVWVGAKTGDKISIANTSGTVNSTSLDSTSTGNNTDSSTMVTLYAGETISIPDETWLTGLASDYNVTGYDCAGNNNALSGGKLTVHPNDVSITCTVTNSRKSASLTLKKIWVNGKTGDAISLTSTGALNNASVNSISNGNNSTSGSTVTVYAGEAISLPAEVWNTGTAGDYTISAPVCTGNTNALVGNVLTVNAADGAITCTVTNSRKSASLTLKKIWVNGKTGDAISLTSTGALNNASVNSISNGNNSTSGSTVTVYAGEAISLPAEVWNTGTAGDYTISAPVCTGNTNALVGNVLTVNAADGAITCTVTNSRKSASLTLKKIWVNGKTGDAISLTSTGALNNASVNSISNGNNSTSGSTVTVYAGEAISLPAEVWNTGTAGDYTISAPVCTGNTNALVGNVLTVNAADGAITCTVTNSRKSASLTLKKIWVNGKTGDAISLTSTGALNNASVNSISNGNNSTSGSTVTVYAGEAISLPAEVWNTGTAGDYTISAPVCTGNTNALVGNVLTVNAADGAITCTVTNSRKVATLVLKKTWVGGKVGDKITYATTGATVNANITSISAGNNIDSGANVPVYSGDTISIPLETWQIGLSSDYIASSLTCTGNTNALTTSGTNRILKISPLDSAIVCGLTNTRKGFDLSISKTTTSTRYAPNQAFSYTIVVSNAGPASADGAILKTQ